MPDEIEIHPYDASWPATFERERLRLDHALAGLGVIATEHFGSTAIPGMPAKPIIDILVAVDDLPRRPATDASCPRPDRL